MNKAQITVISESTNEPFSTQPANQPNSNQLQTPISPTKDPTVKKPADQSINSISPLSQAHLSQSCLKVSVFYSDLSYTSIREDPAITFVTLIGTIGIFFSFTFVVL